MCGLRFHNMDQRDYNVAIVKQFFKPLIILGYVFNAKQFAKSISKTKNKPLTYRQEELLSEWARYEDAYVSYGYQPLTLTDFSMHCDSSSFSKKGLEYVLYQPHNNKPLLYANALCKLLIDQ